MKRDLCFLGLQDGTWDTIKGCFTVIRDFGDFCSYSYISFMQDLRQRIPPNGEHYEIKFVLFPFLSLYLVIVSFESSRMIFTRTQ